MRAILEERSVGELLETMHACYAKACLPAMQARLREGVRGSL